MKQTSLLFSGPHWFDWRGSRQIAPPALQRVAQVFVNLQEDRHLADYDNYEHWTTTEAQEALDKAKAAFEDWDFIRTDPMDGNDLLAMLLGKRRS